jgi:quinol monooxygenase YgiN
VIILAGTLELDPADRDRYVERRREQVERTRKEAGCLDYGITADSVDPSLIIVFECYADEAALTEHRKHLERDTSIPIKSINIWQYETDGRSKLQV